MKTAKKMMFMYTFVESSFKAAGFLDANVIIKPNETYITIIDNPYSKAFIIPFEREPELFVKKETVIGIIGKTQGVNKAMNPQPKPSKKILQELEDSFTFTGSGLITV
jgi:hypothetical protein